jgi:heat shock protein HslJ
MLKSFLKAASAPLLAFGIMWTPSLANAQTVALQSQQNGSYVCFHGGFLSARCDRARALPLEIVRLNDGMVALRNTQNGDFIRAGLTQNTLLGQGGRQIGAWERFQMQEWNGATYFRSPQANAFVRAGIGTDTLLGATSPHMRGWEAFNVVQIASSGPVAAPQPPERARLVAFAGNWRLDQLVTARGGHQPMEGIRPGDNRIMIDGDGSMGFTLGCNEVSGRLVQRGQDRIEAEGSFFTTRMACQNAAFELERKLTQALGQAQRFAVRQGGRFVISGRDGSFIQLMRM